MTVNQAFFATAGLMVTLFGMAMAFFKYYIDAKFSAIDARLDTMSRSIDLLVNYMIEHQGKIATLEERTKKL